jgi:hypothetical protein
MGINPQRSDFVALMMICSFDAGMHCWMYRMRKSFRRDVASSRSAYSRAPRRFREIAFEMDTHQ